MLILLFYAARYGDSPTLKEIYRAGADVNSLDDQGRTPLMYAAIGNYDSTINTLKSCGAIINMADREGKTALHWACQNGHADAARALLYAGADLASKDLLGKNPAHYAAAIESSECLHSVLRFAKPEMIDSLDDEKSTPLMIAAMAGHYECVQTLLNFGANFEKKGRHDMSAFHHLYKNRNTKCCSIMVRFNFKAIGLKDKYGRTLLHLAAGAGNVTIVNFLLESGANHLEIDSFKRTALHWATVNGHMACVNILSAKQNGIPLVFLFPGLTSHDSPLSTRLLRSVSTSLRGSEESYPLRVDPSEERIFYQSSRQ
jgi:ankyrin repeat protein